jgi:predicted cobalt transporter CbtA
MFSPSARQRCTSESGMEKTKKTQLSQICFAIGFALLLLQDLKGLSTISQGYSVPWAIIFYTGLVLLAVGYFLK